MLPAQLATRDGIAVQSYTGPAARAMPLPISSEQVRVLREATLHMISRFRATGDEALKRHIVKRIVLVRAISHLPAEAGMERSADARKNDEKWTPARQHAANAAHASMLKRVARGNGNPVEDASSLAKGADSLLSRAVQPGYDGGSSIESVWAAAQSLQLGHRSQTQRLALAQRYFARLAALRPEAKTIERTPLALRAA